MPLSTYSGPGLSPWMSLLERDATSSAALGMTISSADPPEDCWSTTMSRCLQAALCGAVGAPTGAGGGQQSLNDLINGCS